MAFTHFKSGVKRYINAIAVVEMKFPVDFKENTYICCDQCDYYSRSGKRCNLTRRVCEFPDRSVASHCPLQWDDGEPVNNFENEKE
jgi:hypothetical protein